MSAGGFVGEILSRYAATSLYLYDVVMTLNDEIELVWSSRWSVPKCSYLLLRYFGLAQSIFSCAISVMPMSPDFCYKYGWFSSTWLLVDAGLADLLSLLRILALVRPTMPRLALGLKITYGVVYCIEFALLVYDLNSLASEYTDHGSYIDNLGCVTVDMYYVPMRTGVSTQDLTLAVAAAPILVLNLVFLFLVLHYLLPYWRRSSPPLITAFLHGGVAWFFILALATAFVIISPAIYYNSPGRELMGLPWFLALSPVASCRLFLSLRAAGRATPRIARGVGADDTYLTMPSQDSAPAILPRSFSSPTTDIIDIGIPLQDIPPKASSSSTA